MLVIVVCTQNEDPIKKYFNIFCYYCISKFGCCCKSILFYLLRHPDISHAARKRTKSDTSILSLSLEDPASNDGMIKICEKLVPFLPSHPSGRKQKCIVFGDQGYVERGQFLIWHGMHFLAVVWHNTLFL